MPEYRVKESIWALFHLAGDLDAVNAYGVDTNDPKAMAAFYAMSEKELDEKYIDRSGPEYTDWEN